MRELQRVVRRLMCQTCSDIALKGVVSGHGEALAVFGVVMLKYLEKSVFFSKLNLACVVDVGIKQRSNVQVRVVVTEDTEVLNSLDDGVRGQDRVESAVSAQMHPVLSDVGGDCSTVFRLVVLRYRDKVLDALVIGPILVAHTRHRHLRLVHVLQEGLFLVWIAKSVLLIDSLGLFERNRCAHVMCALGLDHLSDESEQIAVTDAVGNGIT